MALCGGRAMTANSANGGVTIVKFTDGRIAEIVLDRSGITEHVLGAMDLVRLMLQAGITAASIRFRADPGDRRPGKSRRPTQRGNLVMTQKLKLEVASEFNKAAAATTVPD